MGEFCAECLEQIKHYVYALVDPREGRSDLNKIFYIGKGTGNRCFAHAKQELKAEELSDKQLKLDTIRKIREEMKRSPDVVIVAHGMEEEDAFRLESVLISLGSPLTNAIRGHRHEGYWISAADLNASYRDPLPRKDIQGNILLVSLNGGQRLVPYPKIPDNELEKRTLGAWQVHPKKAGEVDYVIGVYSGLTRCVYNVEKQSDGTSVFDIIKPKKPLGKRRVRFHGRVDSKEDWLRRSIVDDDGEILTKFRRQEGCRLLK
jgi:hypothetical protein